MAASPLLAIAHFCDIHGPTPLMVTQAQTVPCFICVDCYQNDSDDQDHPKSGKGSQSSIQSADKLKTVAQITSTVLNTTLETPDGKSTLQELPNRRRDSSFRKTYNEDDKKQASPCGNCALTIPSHLKGKIPSGAAGSPSQNEGSPYLRTRRPIQRVPTPSEDTPSSSSSSSTPSTSDISDSDTSDAQTRPTLARDSSSTVQQITFTTSSEDKDAPPTVHEHYLDYTSTHTPLSSPTYTLLRNCCLRTLSTENLPPSTICPPTSTPITTNASSHSTSSGGPIFFGDPLAGYTTAYIFRIPDPCARGRIRRYALMALDTSGQRRAMRSFSFLATKFRELASWILELAEREAERLESANTEITITSSESSPGGQGSEAADKKTSLVSYPTPMSPLPLKTELGSGRQTKFKQTSSFLSGRTFDPDGYLRKGGYNVFRARGLAELVGMEDFFLELHRRFVVLLAQLG